MRKLLLITVSIIGYAGALWIFHLAVLANYAHLLPYLLAVGLCIGASLVIALILSEGAKRWKLVQIAAWTAIFTLAMGFLLFSIEATYLNPLT